MNTLIYIHTITYILNLQNVEHTQFVHGVNNIVYFFLCFFFKF